VDATLPRAEAAARRAIELDAELADGYLARAYVQDTRGHHLLAEELYSKALALDPSNPDAVSLYANLLAGVGRLKEALAIKQRALSLDPFVPIYIQTDATFLWLNGQADAAIAMLKPMPRGQGRALRLAEIYAASGRYSDAAETLVEIPSGALPRGIVEEAVQLLRSAPAQAPSPQTLPSIGPLEFVYLHVGASNRVLDFYERSIDAGRLESFTNAFLWHPSYAPVRKTERFKSFLRRMDLVDYWRAKGWPEFCHPIGVDDFACD
jgi:tetratricopeptide (TPR) repeat protein